MTTNNTNLEDYRETLADARRLLQFAELDHNDDVSDIIAACDYFGIDFDEYCTGEEEDGEMIYDEDELDEVCQAIRDQFAQDALCLDTVHFVDVALTLGGPTVYIRFPVCGESGNWELNGNAEYHSNANQGHTTQVVYLTDSETEALFELYNVAYAN